MPEQEIPFPVNGYDVTFAPNKQPEGTTPDALNVRAFEQIERRVAGGQRHGYSKWSDEVASGVSIQTMEKVVSREAVTQTSAFEWGKEDSTNAGASDIRLDPNGEKGGIYFAHYNADVTVVKRSSSGAQIYRHEVYGTPSSGLNTQIAFGANDELFVIRYQGVSKTAEIIHIDKDATALNALASFDLTNYVGSAVRGVYVNASNRIVIAGASGAGKEDITILDYDADANSFSLVWAFDVLDLSLTNNQVTSVYLHSDNDTLYFLIEDGGSDSFNKVKIGTQSVTWSQSLSSSIVADEFDNNEHGGSYVNSTGDGIFYVSGQATSGTGRIMSSYRDDGAGTTLLWSYDTGSSSSCGGPIYLKDGFIWLQETGGAVTGAKWTKFATTGVAVGSVTSNVSGEFPQRFVVGEDDSGQENIYAALNSAIVTVPTPSTVDDFKYSGANIGETNRSIALVVSAGGNIKKVDANGQVTAATGGSGVLSTSDTLVKSSALYNNVYFVDGGNYYTYNVTTNTAAEWTAQVTDGTMPSNGANTATLIATHRRRIVLSGIPGKGDEIYASKSGDPLDWQYAPATATWRTAVKFTATDNNGVSDIVTALIEHNDDLLVIGCDHSIAVLVGDPAIPARGQIDTVVPDIGMAFDAWCRDPEGVIYFVGNTGKIYQMSISGDAVQRPQLISGQIDPELLRLGLAAYRFHLVWDHYTDSLYVYATPVDTLQTNLAYVWEGKNGWQKDNHPSRLGPISTIVYDGDRQSDREILLGGRDGYIYRIDRSAKTDDGDAISSHVFLPPIRPGSNEREIAVNGLFATMGKFSDSVDYAIHVGKSTQEALASTAAFTGTWTGGGRMPDEFNRARGNAVLVKLSNTTSGESWSMEEIAADLKPVGRVRG